MLIPEAEIQNPDVQEFAAEARNFVEGMRWCRSVPEIRLAFAVAGVLGIFEADIEAAAPNVDPIVWVVVGDLPPAYLYHEVGDTWQDALSGYCFEMRRWVDSVRSGASLDDVMPVNVPPTPEYADMLASRLDFLQSELVEVNAATLESDR